MADGVDCGLSVYFAGIELSMGSLLSSYRSANQKWIVLKHVVILLMEEILHHLGCVKLCKLWDKLPTSTGDRRISSISRDGPELRCKTTPREPATR